MAVAISEQETVIQIDRQTEQANIYTSDARMISKLDKIYSRTKEYKQRGRVVAVEYVAPENLISFRKGRNKVKPLTDVEKKERTKRLPNRQEQKG